MTGEADPRAELQRASQARREGRLDEVRAAVEALIARLPGHGPALNLAGLIAQGQGRIADAVALLQRATNADPDVPPVWLNLAVALRIAGDTPGEIDALDRVLVLDPTLLPALLLKAAALERLSRIEESARAYRSLLAAAGDQSKLPDEVRKALAIGQEVARRDDEARAAQHGDAIEAVFRANHGTDMRRARVYADALLGRRRVFSAQPTGPLFPYLPAYEFHDDAQFPWFAELEAATEAIRGELVGIWQGGECHFDPYVQFAPGKPVNNGPNSTGARDGGRSSSGRTASARPMPAHHAPPPRRSSIACRCSIFWGSHRRRCCRSSTPARASRRTPASPTRG